jgi:hypothetical protein
MIKQAIATGVVGLGLVGGAAHVVHNNDGSSTVTITDHGKKSTVTISGNGRSYSCPESLRSTFDSQTELLAREQLTSKKLKAKLKRIERAHPGHTASPSVVAEYNSLVTREKAIVSSYNATVESHNAALKSECKPSN